jgi:hypothetical protein
VIKALASFVLLLCFCLLGWAREKVACVDSNAIEQEIRNAVRDLQIRIPELLEDIRIRVQIPDIELHIPEINLQLPEIRIPETHVQRPLDIHIPEIRIPEIRIQIPKIDIQKRELLK